MKDLMSDKASRSTGGKVREPSLEELEAFLERHLDGDGAVLAGLGPELAEEAGWGGRLVEVLAVLTRDAEKMAYLAGGQRPEEVMEAVAMWAASPLSVEEICLVTESGGWDPDPMVVLAKAGLLEAVLRLPDGSARRIRGELAGGWVSDQLATADDGTIVEAARRVVDGDRERAAQTVRVTYVDGDQFEIAVRHHLVRVDQPLDDGGKDTAPTPTELFVASLAACVGFSARRFLDRHHLPTDGLSVEAGYAVSARPARVSEVEIRILVPGGVPAERQAGLLAVARHCTVHNTLEKPPAVAIELWGARAAGPAGGTRSV